MEQYVFEFERYRKPCIVSKWRDKLLLQMISRLNFCRRLAGSSKFGHFSRAVYCLHISLLPEARAAKPTTRFNMSNLSRIPGSIRRETVPFKGTVSWIMWARIAEKAGVYSMYTICRKREIVFYDAEIWFALKGLLHELKMSWKSCVWFPHDCGKKFWRRAQLLHVSLFKLINIVSDYIWRKWTDFANYLPRCTVKCA